MRCLFSPSLPTISPRLKIFRSFASVHHREGVVCSVEVSNLKLLLFVLCVLFFFSCLPVMLISFACVLQPDARDDGFAHTIIYP